MKKILITGATGFVGSHFINKYSETYEFFPLIRRESKVERISNHVRLQNIIFFDEKKIINDLKRNPCDILIHLASLSKIEEQFEDVASILKSNCLFGSQIFDAFLRTGGKKILNIGSWWQYYPSDCLYTLTKQFTEQLLVHYANQYKMNYLNLRLFDNYGRGDWRPKIFNRIIHAADTRESLNATKGQQLINLTHVEDVCRGLHCAIEWIEKESVVNQTYALANPEMCHLKEVVQLFIKLHNLDVQINWGAREYSCRDHFSMPKEAMARVPGWEPQWKLREGLATLL